MGFFSNLFSGNKPEESAEKQQKNREKNFEILKYDGMRAQRMGQQDYAIKCFREALELYTDFETMGYLAQSYTQVGRLEEAIGLLQQMSELEPTHTDTLISLANLCYMAENYTAMAAAAQKATNLQPENANAHYLLGKAVRGEGNDIMCIAHLTKAILLNEQFTEARLMRAEILLHMRQCKEALEDIDAILNQDADDEAAILLRGKVNEATGKPTEAETDYRRVIELNPFNEQAFKLLGQLLTSQKRLDEATALLKEAMEMNPGFGKDISGEYNNQPLVKNADILGL